MSNIYCKFVAHSVIEKYGFILHWQKFVVLSCERTLKSKMVNFADGTGTWFVISWYVGGISSGGGDKSDKGSTVPYNGQ